MPGSDVEPFVRAPGAGVAVENPVGGVLTFKAMSAATSGAVTAIETLVDAPARSFVFIPRGTPHTWRNAGDGEATFFATLAPADRRFEQFFVRYSELPAHERGAEAFARIAAETQALEVVGPRLG